MIVFRVKGCVKKKGTSPRTRNVARRGTKGKTSKRRKSDTRVKESMIGE